MRRFSLGPYHTASTAGCAWPPRQAQRAHSGNVGQLNLYSHLMATWEQYRPSTQPSTMVADV
jgi:hypothetical protein